MLDVAIASSCVEPVAYAATHRIMLDANHALDAAVICFVICRRWRRRLSSRVVTNVIGATYTMPMSDAVTIPATIAAASVLMGATAEYASYDAYNMPISG